MLEAENLLENPKLKRFISEKVVEMITLKNCFYFFKLSKTFHLNLLQDFLYNFFIQCYLNKINVLGFYELSYEDLKNLFSLSELEIDSELELFNALVDWISYKQTEREIYTDKLLELVRLPLLTKEIIVDVIQAHPLCSNNFKCKSVVTKALRIKRRKSQFRSNTSLQNRFYSQKIGSKEVVFVSRDYAGKAEESPVAVTYRVDSSTINEIETTVEAMHKKTCNFVAVGLKIYCIGGLDDDGNASRSFHVFTRTTGRWQRLPDLPSGRFYFSTCSFMGNVHVFSGLGSRNSLVYDADDCGWKKLAHTIAAPEWGTSCVVFNGQCLVAGGEKVSACGRSEYFRGVESYDHHLDEWTLLPDMREGRSCPGLLARGNKLYVVGGGEFESSHEVYDCVTKSFTFIASYELKGWTKNEKFLVTSGNSVFVFTCQMEHDDNETKVFVPTYDTVKNVWRTTTKTYCQNIDTYGHSTIKLQKYLK